MKTRIRIAYVMIAATYVATISSILLGCRPLRRNWQIHPDPGSTSPPRLWSAAMLTGPDFCQPAISKINVYVTVVLNVATDVYLLLIPAPVCLSYQEKSGKEKSGVRAEVRADALEGTSSTAPEDRPDGPVQRGHLCHGGGNPPLRLDPHGKPVVHMARDVSWKRPHDICSRPATTAPSRPAAGRAASRSWRSRSTTSP